MISDSVQNVETGARLVDEAGKTMEEIVSSVKHVSGIVAGITIAANEQSVGIEQVNEAVSQMDQTTQQNAALVEEAAAAAESMREQAAGLERAVAVFDIGEVKASAVHHDRPSERMDGGEKIARFPARASSEPVQTRVELKKTGTHDEWSEF